ncbi:hypothetical protein AXW83_25660 [Bosea sp. PAMC 26642]|nr:hypothetical protein AXW83_25660 [Bosea sp. PAMC 26642]
MQPNTKPVSEAIHPEARRRQAVALAKQGRRVFPLLPNGKTPAVEGGLTRATSDPERVHRFWSEAFSGDPLDYNIGIATGEGLLVVDVDNKNGKNGSLSLEALELRNDDLPLSLTVRTPTGGEHIYLTTPEGVYVRNSASTLGEGLDIRGDGGYVVAPGSVIDGKAYAVAIDAEDASAPDWLLPVVSGPRPVKTQAPAANDDDLDTPEAIARATDYLVSRAPLHGTYSVANGVLDYGVTIETACGLMVEHWNDRRPEPRSEEHIRERVQHAADYRHNPIGSSSADVEFQHEEIDQKPIVRTDDDEWPKPTPTSCSDPALIPPREWIVPALLARTFVTALISPGGMGKTSLGLALGHAIATGRPDVIGVAVPSQAKVWYWNQEDDGAELRRRNAAIRQLHNICPEQLHIDGDPALFVDSGVERPLMIATRSPGGAIKTAPEVKRIIEQIKRNGIDVFIVDPLVELHEADENNNKEMASVLRTLREIAVRGNCAVMVVAHTRKPAGASSEGHSGDVNSWRGAGSQGGVVRLAYTLDRMTQSEANALKVRPEDRSWYTKLDSAKHNLTPRGADPLWFKSVGVTIANGEQVGAIQPANFSAADLARPVLGPLEETLLAAFWTAIRRKGPFETVLTTAEWMAEAELAWAKSGSAASDPKESIRKSRHALEKKRAVKKVKPNQWLALVPEAAEVTEVDEVGRAEVGSPPIGGLPLLPLPALPSRCWAGEIGHDAPPFGYDSGQVAPADVESDARQARAVPQRRLDPILWPAVRMLRR